MPIEYDLLKDYPMSLEICPKCGADPFRQFLRGQIQRCKRKWLIGSKQDYCAVICWGCKAIVGYESPLMEMERAK